MDMDGFSTGAAKPITRGANLTTTEHVDASASSIDVPSEDIDLLDDKDDKLCDIPEGAVAFTITAADIEEALKAESADVKPREEVDVPAHLVSDEELDALFTKHGPKFVPLSTPSATSEALPAKDPNPGVVQRKLSNGICINYR
jgi:hypothetical protein